MNTSATAWWAPKSGNTANEYEDAYAVKPEALRFAAADGASETSFARQWAEPAPRAVRGGSGGGGGVLPPPVGGAPGRRIRPGCSVRGGAARVRVAAPGVVGRRPEGQGHGLVLGAQGGRRRVLVAARRHHRGRPLARARHRRQLPVRGALGQGAARIPARACRAVQQPALAALQHRARERRGVERGRHRRGRAQGQRPAVAHDRRARPVVPGRGGDGTPAVGGALQGHHARAVRGVHRLPARRRRAAQRRRHAGERGGRGVNWPTMSDYQEAVQNPANCFSDAQLKAGTPTLNALGLPSPVTGGFCRVYQVTSGKTRWAVRCFLHNIRDGRERYKEISKYLRGRKLKETVGFEYVQDGIRVRGDWHPVLKMEWVDGLQLNTWVDRHSQDPKALRQLEERWAALMDALEAQKIGHCDLQHGNVLVDTHDHLKLIDYDGMYVPALRGKGSHEKGHPAYQHPQRDGRDFDDTIDRFAALVISTSLIAVAESPALWKRFYDDDNLIFKRHDFMDPDGAPVFQELKKLKGVVADRAGVLRDACKKRQTETPRLRDVRGGSSRGAEKKRAKIFQIPFAAKKPAQAQAAAPMKKVAGGGAVPAGPPALPAAR